MPSPQRPDTGQQPVESLEERAYEAAAAIIMDAGEGGNVSAWALAKAVHAALEVAHPEALAAERLASVARRYLDALDEVGRNLESHAIATKAAEAREELRAALEAYSGDST